MRLPLGFLNLFLRLMEKPHLRRARDVPKMRRRFARQARWLFSDPPFATYLPDHLKHQGHDVPALWAQAGSPKNDGVILYLHGGAYVIGGSITHRAMLARLSALTGLRTILPDYRMAPEHPFPAAIKDARTAYCALLARGYQAEQIVLGGDSAGGGLMLALLHVICTENLPRPGAVFAFSPWTDLTLSGDSIASNAKSDPFLPADRMPELRDMYLGNADPSEPRASPLFGDFTDAPGVFIQVGDTEILLDDSRRMLAALQAQGVDARMDIWPNTPHVWQMFQGYLVEADKALADVAAFINRSLKS
ncbi:MAG: alpha/beta hydrolase [Alphaproteobacteria bacterium]|nr:alpha/beta hydrolase [Alphaproteobacteria bacterium]